ncbi:MAG: family peptidase [Microbacterium sp.]|jgi:hypothetical protein|nr:family peptidase [Microbacterium sp.]
MPGPYLRPVENRISSDYRDHRNRRPPSSNPGTDFACPKRTPVVAPMDSTVVRVSQVADQPQGRHVWLRGHDGAELQMMHFDAPQVSAGQRLSAGQQIGLSGNTGNSTGPHLHVSLWYQGRTLDFMDYVTTGRPAAAAVEKGFLMALSDFQQAQMYDALVAHSPSGDYYKTDAAINDNRALMGNVLTALASIAAGNITFPGAGYNAFVAVVNTIREGNGQAPVEIDEEALAKGLAPALAPLLLTQGFGDIDDATVERLAKAAADERDRRDRERLAIGTEPSS